MNIALYTLKAVAFALVEPAFMMILVFLAIVFYLQNKKIAVMQKMIIGERLNSPFELTISQIGIGILAGVFGSLILSYLGIIFDENSAIDLLFFVSIILMIWSPKFICFAYSGAVLGLFSFIFSKIAYLYNNVVVSIGTFKFNLGDLDFLRIDIPALMMMIAVLHFIEGILVIVDGKTGSIPVFTNKDGKIIGGFALKRYWALPIAIFIMLSGQSLIGAGGGDPMPDWWPLVHGSLPINILRDAVVALIPFYGVIGYNSITFTKSRKQKTRIAGSFILLYSVALLGVGQLATQGPFFELFAIVFAPVAHELMIIAQQRMELRGKPKYISSEDGIMVLEVAPNSPAFEMGIESGDIVVEINDSKVVKEEDILNSLGKNINFVWLKVKRASGKLEELSYNKMNTRKKLGIVFVPQSVPSDSMVVKLDELKFKEILEKIKNKNKEDE